MILYEKDQNKKKIKIHDNQQQQKMIIVCYYHIRYSIQKSNHYQIPIHCLIV